MIVVSFYRLSRELETIVSKYRIVLKSIKFVYAFSHRFIRFLEIETIFKNAFRSSNEEVVGTSSTRLFLGRRCIIFWEKLGEKRREKGTSYGLQMVMMLNMRWEGSGAGGIGTRNRFNIGYYTPSKSILFGIHLLSL